MLFKKKKQTIREPVFKLGSRDLVKSTYEIGVLMWEKGIKDRFVRDREVAAVKRQEDETRDSISYRLPNEIDLFLGIELSKKIRKTVALKRGFKNLIALLCFSI